jgi:alpha-L-rhamnosidase
MRTIVRIFIFLLLFSACKQKQPSGPVNVVNLRIEYKENPIGVDIEKPRFSWILESEARGVSQTAYHILVASSQENLDKNVADVWESQKVQSDLSNQIEYQGSPLESNRKYFWKVKIWDQKGELQESKPAFWTTGLMHESDWKAKWIGLDKLVGSDDTISAHKVLSARMVRNEFSLEKKVKSATTFISGLGLFEFYINGEKIGDQVLAPALTEYDKRTFYMTFDVTGKLADKNTIGVILGNGRYFGPRSGGTERTKTYGFPKVICQVEVEFEDGTKTSIVSDENWKLTASGPIRKNSEYDGEYYDARMEFFGWNKTGFDDSGWNNAELVEKPGAKLEAQPSEPIKITEEIAPVSVKEIKPGTFIFDMGQNMVGWVELFVKGQKGDKVTLRFSERLNADGSLYLDNIRTAEVTDTYILKGDGEEKWEPRFTYHGFQYVEMVGYPGAPALSSIKGKVIHDALDVAGSFRTSNSIINSVYKNAYWGIRGNYRSMPTDCPQRDERQGWLGDRSAECTGESYIFDISKLYNKWVTDINDTQIESGSISDVAPSYWPFYTDNTTWPGTFLFASDMLYTQYGDKKAIEANYPAMQKWVAHMSQFLNNGIMPKDMYGDWCVPPEDLRLINSSDPQRITRADYIGTSYFYYELKLMAKFARLLGKEEDAAGYLKTAEEMKKAFNDKFLEPTEVKYSNNTCTANILALAFDLVPDEHKAKIVDNLLQKILSENGGHVGNGIVGGQWLMRSLTNSGHADVAYTLAAQNTYPSWGYMVEQGATTIWELWNGDFGDPGMNSGNHVMLLGDLIIWYYENLAGIKPDPEIPGFKHFIMKPLALGDLTSVDASYNSIYGTIKSAWKLEDGKFAWNITVPANTTATVCVPTLEKENVREGEKSAKNSEGVKFVKWEENTAVFEVQSGNYSFTSKGVKKIVTEPYMPTPVISPADTLMTTGNKLEVNISCNNPDAKIHFTTDGSMVTESSPLYEKPIEITDNTVVKALAFGDSYQTSNQTKVVYSFIDPANNGIIWTRYDGKFINIPDLSKMKPVENGVAYKFDLKKMKLPKYNFVLQLKTFIDIEKEGDYTLYLTSNDGSKLYLNDQLFIDNDGEHGAKEMSNTAHLAKGRHPIKVEYFQGGGSTVLSLSYSSAEIRYQPVPESILFKSKE